MLPLHEQSALNHPPPATELGQSPHTVTSPAILLREAYARSSTTPSYPITGTATLPLVAASSQVSQSPKLPGAAASIATCVSAIPANGSSVSIFSKRGPHRGVGRNSVVPLKSVVESLPNNAKVSCLALGAYGTIFPEIRGR